MSPYTGNPNDERINAVVVVRAGAVVTSLGAVGVIALQLLAAHATSGIVADPWGTALLTGLASCTAVAGLVVLALGLRARRSWTTRARPPHRSSPATGPTRPGPAGP